MKSTHSSNLPLWLALILTLAMVIFVRETAVLVCQWAGIEKAANIVGLVVMFVVLMAWRLLKGLPSWLTQASNTLLVDSGFAFLPVSAGAGLLLFALGDELWGVMLTMLISTLIPLWGLALLANRWLNQDTDTESDSDSQADNTGSTSKQHGQRSAE
ncbi:CidA/LrgA family protein [Psychrobacter sp. CAM01]|uniref:CidA/LrgA family protein n=1 Tax=Psychrobacter sp. CAM01 TaxID=3080335 RepID=UPI002935D0D0|nr:CidA/LrgA family protein [Psychrobacter sp. CAM01]MDV2860553.1 CidA/LrgA family protein [Psychrobacter sp. CAM01]